MQLAAPDDPHLAALVPRVIDSSFAKFSTDG
jgi:hypothetical protein